MNQRVCLCKLFSGVINEGEGQEKTENGSIKEGWDDDECLLRGGVMCCQQEKALSEGWGGGLRL